MSQIKASFIAAALVAAATALSATTHAATAAPSLAADAKTCVKPEGRFQTRAFVPMEAGCWKTAVICLADKKPLLLSVVSFAPKPYLDRAGADQHIADTYSKAVIGMFARTLAGKTSKTWTESGAELKAPSVALREKFRQDYKVDMAYDYDHDGIALDELPEHQNICKTPGQSLILGQ